MIQTSVLVVALLIILLVVFIVSNFMLVKVFGWKSGNLACKAAANQFKVALFLPFIQFSPFGFVCDIVAPF